MSRKKTVERDSIYSKIKTLKVGVGLYLHQTTRSKNILIYFLDLIWASVPRGSLTSRKTWQMQFPKNVMKTMDSSSLRIYFPIKDHSLLQPTLMWKFIHQQEKDNFMVQQWQHFNNTYLWCKYKENLND